MRHIQIIVPRGHGAEAVELASQHGLQNTACSEAQGTGGPLDVVTGNVDNHRLDALVDGLQRLPELRITFSPHGVLALEPPAKTAHASITEVTHRSPIEIFLSGLQSVGSWGPFLAYAAAAGAVVWIGLFTNTWYLLTAAMLIAPFAGPAMNAALATSRGDGMLLLRSVARYAASIAVTIATAALLSLVMGQTVATSLMAQASAVSSTAVLLPIVAGAAGALNLGQSDRSSLVSGAATGMLVAASLAPPAGLVGMAGVLRDWEMVRGGVFVLLLQIVGINFSGALVFRLYGVSPDAPRYKRGRRSVVAAGYAVALAGLAALLTWQFWTQPNLQRSTRTTRAAAAIREVVNGSELGKLVEAEVRFTRANIPGQDTLLATVHVQRAPSAPLDDQALAKALHDQIQERLLQPDFAVTPLVDVTVLTPPPAHRLPR